MQAYDTPQRRPFRGLATLAIGLLCGWGAVAASAWADQGADSRAVVIRDADKEGGGLQFSFEPTKEGYRVDEPIRFRLRSNKTFFLYVYAVDEGGAEATLLIPNKRHGNKYRADRTFIVPNADMEFAADRPGINRLVVLGSTRYIDVDLKRFRSAGDYYSAKTMELEGAFAEKGIRIRDRKPEGDRRPTSERQGDVVVKEVELQIRGASGGLASQLDSELDRYDGSNSVIAFVSTDRQRYYEGERVRVAFGADAGGWVHLFTVEPGGGYSQLSRREVDGGRVYHVVARAEAPAGTHSIVAVFSKDGAIDERLLDEVVDEGITKGLRLKDKDQTGIAVSQFRIDR
ncbi:MAG: DUF4384 domain-containing protein [Chromatiales bacterium]|nr:DUF4384 domain-containing protein [Chromatiales bacterium]